MQMAILAAPSAALFWGDCTNVVLAMRCTHLDLLTWDLLTGIYQYREATFLLGNDVWQNTAPQDRDFIFEDEFSFFQPL